MLPTYGTFTACLWPNYGLVYGLTYGLTYGLSIFHYGLTISYDFRSQNHHPLFEINVN